jgi:hypothetical protein
MQSLQEYFYVYKSCDYCEVRKEASRGRQTNPATLRKNELDLPPIKHIYRGTSIIIVLSDMA